MIDVLERNYRISILSENLGNGIIFRFYDDPEAPVFISAKDINNSEKRFFVNIQNGMIMPFDKNKEIFLNPIDIFEQRDTTFNIDIPRVGEGDRIINSLGKEYTVICNPESIYILSLQDENGYMSDFNYSEKYYVIDKCLE